MSNQPASACKDAYVAIELTDRAGKTASFDPRECTDHDDQRNPGCIRADSHCILFGGSDQSAITESLEQLPAEVRGPIVVFDQYRERLRAASDRERLAAGGQRSGAGYRYRQRQSNERHAGLRTLSSKLSDPDHAGVPAICLPMRLPTALSN